MWKKIDAYFVILWVKSFRRVQAKLCSILLGLGQPPSHMWTVLIKAFFLISLFFWCEFLIMFAVRINHQASKRENSKSAHTVLYQFQRDDVFIFFIFLTYSLSGNVRKEKIEIPQWPYESQPISLTRVRFGQIGCNSRLDNSIRRLSWNVIFFFSLHFLWK